MTVRFEIIAATKNLHCLIFAYNAQMSMSNYCQKYVVYKDFEISKNTTLDGSFECTKLGDKQKSYSEFNVNFVPHQILY